MDLTTGSNARSKTEKNVSLIKKLLEAGCLKFGEFILKSNVKANYYIDLREASMHMNLFDCMIELAKERVMEQEKILNPDKTPVAIVGVPYGVWPLAASVARDCRLPFYPVRKEIKDYGNKPDAGNYANHEFVLIEDVMSSGSSIIETLKKLDGKKVTDVIVIVDRELGGREKLEIDYPDIKLHSILKASEILKTHEQLR